jgi:dipeptidyl-peptidase 4
MITVKARDGVTDIYGLMFTPTQLDPTRRYPIVNYIYPGPWGSSVGSWSFSPRTATTRRWRSSASWSWPSTAWAPSCAPRSSWTSTTANMGDNTIPDQIAGMRELAQRHRYIDIERAGIWGHSGGGFATASAMFRHPDFFKVGVSQAGNHDNRNYVDSWSERFQGLLRRTNGGDNYEIQANQLVAQNLRGQAAARARRHGRQRVALQHLPGRGRADQGEQGLRPDRLPHARHGFGVDNNYMMRRRWDYFVRHLMGAETAAGVSDRRLIRQDNATRRRWSGRGIG